MISFKNLSNEGIADLSKNIDRTNAMHANKNICWVSPMCVKIIYTNATKGIMIPIKYIAFLLLSRAVSSLEDMININTK
jgi:hypothetical protein